MLTCRFPRSVGLCQAVPVVGVVPAERAEPRCAAEGRLPLGTLPLLEWGSQDLKGIDDLSSSYFSVASGE